MHEMGNIEPVYTFHLYSDAIQNVHEMTVLRNYCYGHCIVISQQLQSGGKWISFQTLKYPQS